MTFFDAHARALVAIGGLAALAPVVAHAQAPIPVTTAVSAKADVPVYLRGIGVVQAQNQVTVRARVDGTLLKVPVIEGQDVKAGDLLAVIDPRPYQATLDQALAKKAQDTATQANAQADLRRYSALAKSDFASRQQVDTQTATVASSAAQLKSDDATIEAAQLNLSYCFVMAPFDGRVGLRTIDPGNLIRATDATGIMMLTQVHPIAVVFTLPQDDLPAVTATMSGAARPPVIALSADGRTELDRGSLLTVDNAVDAATGTIRVKAVFANTAGRLWPGQFVNARLLADTKRGVVVVPSEAVQRGPDGLFVYVVKPDKTAARAAVEVSQDDGGTAVIARGLDAGTDVVVAGQSRLQVGLKVAATQAKPATTSANAPPTPPASGLPASGVPTATATAVSGG